MVNVFHENELPTDRDHFKYKRVDTPGVLLYELFKEYYTLQIKNIFQTIDKEFHYNKEAAQANFTTIVSDNKIKFFKERILERGIKKAFKGNWGAKPHTKKVGIVQDLNRLSYNSFLSHLRKVILPFDSSSKITGPRLLHNSQWDILTRWTPPMAAMSAYINTWQSLPPSQNNRP